jgi:sterol desaturase/sphingolipid hydroxylase (fatty acid hydroxylase superfamily)
MPPIGPIIADLAFVTLVLTAAIAARYLAIAWVVHRLIWRRKDGRVPGRRLNRDRPRPATIRHELKLSLLSSWIYALPAAVVLEAWKHGGTMVYLDVGKYGVAYLFVSGAIYLLVQDTYYYWLHRLMHVKPLFAFMHAGHHRSRQPTAYASFSFDWAEAALSAWLLPAMTFFVPIHPIVIVVLLTVMTLAAVLNHAGAEVLPDWLVHSWLGGWLISASHHSLHHTHYGANYGLYFRFWDRALGTDMAPAPTPAAAASPAPVSPEASSGG